MANSVKLIIALCVKEKNIAHSLYGRSLAQGKETRVMIIVGIQLDIIIFLLEDNLLR